MVFDWPRETVTNVRDPNGFGHIEGQRRWDVEPGNSENGWNPFSGNGRKQTDLAEGPFERKTATNCRIPCLLMSFSATAWVNLPMGAGLRSRSSSREVRIRDPTFSAVYFTKGTLPTKKG